MHEAAGEVLERAKQLAADLLEAGVDDVVLDTDSGRFHVAGTPAIGRTWSEVAGAALEGGGDPLAVEHVFHSTGATFPSGAHVAVVDALSHLGIRHIDMPCTPERVWSAIRAAAAAG